MPSLRDYRRRIKSLQSTQKICKAMKAVATARMAKAQVAVTAARPYARQIHEVLGRLSKAAGDVRHPLLAVREPKKVCYIVITADRGLCGGFNSNVLRATMRESSAHPGADIIAVGRKARNFFRFRRIPMQGEFVGLGDDIKFANARLIVKDAIDKYASGEYDAVYVIYSKFVNILVQQPTVVKVLPVEPPAAEEGAAGEESKKGPQPLYIFEPSAEAVLYDLLPKYVETVVFHAILESKAGEHSARMTAMDGATKSSAEMIDTFTLKMNRARQEGITKELLEIVSGAAALE
ncbi:MAG: ATP synthase F1 subunit gamma [Bacillota bacterium]